MQEIENIIETDNERLTCDYNICIYVLVIFHEPESLIISYCVHFDVVYRNDVRVFLGYTTDDNLDE
jgi:hypothetical protein